MGWPRLGAITALVLLAVFASACGDDDDSSSSTARSDDAPQESPSPVPPPAAGGEKSIENFGSEAQGGARTELLAAFRGYLTAVADEDYAAICDGLAAQVHESLAELVRRAGGPTECESVMPKLLSVNATKTASQQAKGQVTKVRVEDDQAFVVYKAPGAKRYQMTMVEEDGDWKAATAMGNILVPLPAIGR